MIKYSFIISRLKDRSLRVCNKWTLQHLVYTVE